MNKKKNDNSDKKSSITDFFVPSAKKEVYVLWVSYIENSE